MCYVKSGKSAADIAASAAAAAAAAASASTTAPVSTDPFAFPELFNLGGDAFGTIDGLDKWNFGELLNGVVADSMIPTELPMLDNNSFLTKWYGSDSNASPADSVDGTFTTQQQINQLSPTSSSATLVGSGLGYDSLMCSPNYTSVSVSPSSSASPNLIPATGVIPTAPASSVNFFPPEVALPPYLQFAPVYPAAAVAPAYPTPASVISTPAVEKKGTATVIAPPAVVAAPETPSLSPEPAKQIKRAHDDHHSGSDSCGDPLAAKRQKNTEAARRSRQRKVVQMETLQGQVSELQGENSRLNVRLAVVESERDQWVAKENELMERIRSLERQLNESHMAVVSLGLKKATAGGRA
ncbi:hypothetical protein BJ742DRAFT_63192 [Cladochytrium replicatum]|nr:hypothetical protein BJ742DRAFT_63192 [Cladochytrium replicatum]